MIWNLTPVCLLSKGYKKLLLIESSLVFMMFLFGDSFPLTFSSLLKKANEGGTLVKFPLGPKSLNLQMAYWYTSVPLGNCQLRQACQICQATSRDARLKNVGNPTWMACRFLELFNGWKMTDLLGWRCFFFSGVLSDWRFKLSRLLYTSSYIPIKMKHGPWKISGWETLLSSKQRCNLFLCLASW